MTQPVTDSPSASDPALQQGEESSMSEGVTRAIPDSEAPTYLQDSAPDSTAETDLITMISGVGPAAINLPGSWHPGTVVEGLYRIEDVIATGGMGIVYKAIELSTSSTVVIKSLLPQFADVEEYKARFIREAEEWVNLGAHPHIVRAYTVHEFDWLPRVVAEYVDGQALSERLDGRMMELADALRIALHISWGMTYAHSKGIVHRDLKPGNVMINSQGVAKVMDFGLVKRIDDTQGSSAEFEADTRPNQTMGAMGTAEYMAPEQWQGLAVPASDIYSFGVLLYEMLCGKRPFDSDKKKSKSRFFYLQQAHLSQKAPDPRRRNPNLPDPIAEIIISCLEKSPDKRPADFQTLASQLSHLAKPILGKSVLIPAGRDLSRQERLDQGFGFLRLSQGCIQRGDLNTANDVLKKAYTIFKSLKEATGLANYYRQKGIIHSRFGSYGRAQAMFRKCADVAEETDDLPMLCTAYGNIGNVYLRTSELVKAASMYRKALGLAVQTDDESMMARCRENLGIIYYMQCRVDESLAYYDKALEVYESQRAWERAASCYYNLSLCHLTNDHMAEAEDMAKRGLQFCQVTGSKFQEAALLEAMSQIQLRLGHKKLARLCLQKSKVYFESSEVVGLNHATVKAESSLLLSEGKFKEAESLLREALKSFRRSEDYHHRYLILQILASFLPAMGKTKQALTDLQTCRDIQQMLGMIDRDNISERINELEKHLAEVNDAIES